MIDLTKGLPITSQNIVNALASESPIFIGKKNNKVEFARGFPNMMYTLWGYICTYRAFPTQRSFVSFYRSVHQEALKDFDDTGVTARVLRAYPSLAREIHFFQLVKESNIFDDVSYCAYNDVVDGIDFTVALGGHEYNISCFVATKRSLWFRKKKIFRHEKPIINSIEMSLDLTLGKQIGKWIVFDKKHVDILENKIINYAWNHFHQHPLELLSC